MNAESQTQQQKFIDAARTLDCDESEATFNKKLKGLATAKPQLEKKKKPKKSS